MVLISASSFSRGDGKRLAVKLSLQWVRKEGVVRAEGRVSTAG
jgi:hypothetical protein